MSLYLEATLMVGKDYLGSVKKFTDSVSPTLVGLDRSMLLQR